MGKMTISSWHRGGIDGKCRSHAHQRQMVAVEAGHIEPPVVARNGLKSSGRVLGRWI